MRYYAVTGRCCGDDEDTPLLMGQHPDASSAQEAYRQEMRDTFLTTQEQDDLMRAHGWTAAVTATFSSDSPISVDE